MRFQSDAPAGELTRALEPWIKERRLVGRMMGYWHEIRQGRDMPRLQDIDPQRIGDDWKWAFILDTAECVETPYFKYLGASLARYAGVFLSGRNAWTMTLLDQATTRLAEVVEKRKPLTIEDEVTRFDGARLLFRSVLMPLSEDGDRVDSVLGAANGKLV